MKEKWVRIIETNSNNKTWLHDILDDNKIPYKEDIESYWDGWIKAPKYKEKVFISVPIKYEKQVLEYIEEYNNLNNIVIDDLETRKLFNQLDFSKEDNDLSKSIEIRRKMKFFMSNIILCMIFIPIILAILLCN